MSDLAEAARVLASAALADVANAEKAVGMQAYMKTPMTCGYTCLRCQSRWPCNRQRSPNSPSRFPP